MLKERALSKPERKWLGWGLIAAAAVIWVLGEGITTLMSAVVTLVGMILAGIGMFFAFDDRDI
jgi:hypothetical protein